LSTARSIDQEATCQALRTWIMALLLLSAPV
jgi:hypothetical protein